jgi:hypothetical protein
MVYASSIQGRGSKQIPTLKNDVPVPKMSRKDERQERLLWQRCVHVCVCVCVPRILRYRVMTLTKTHHVDFVILKCFIGGAQQDDAMIRIAGESAGALCMSADRFVTELKSMKQIVAHRVEAAMAKVNGQAMRPEKLWGTTIQLPRASATAATTAAAAATTTRNIKNNNSNNNNRTDLSSPASLSNSATTTNVTTTTDPSTTSFLDTASNDVSVPVKGAEQVVEDGNLFVYRGRFGRGNLIIEDKRHRGNKKG